MNLTQPQQDRWEKVQKLLTPKDYMSQFIDARKHMANLIATCPIHGGSNETLMVYDYEKFKCVTCHFEGDILAFIIALKKLKADEALDLIEQWAKDKIKADFEKVKSGESQRDFLEQKRKHDRITDMRKR